MLANAGGVRRSPLTHPGESSMFDLRAGPGAFSHPASRVEFLFFARHFVSLWGFLFNDGHIQNVSLFDVFVRGCIGLW